MSEADCALCQFYKKLNIVIEESFSIGGSGVIARIVIR